MSTAITLESAENPGTKISIDAHPQTSITAGEAPDTSIVVTHDGKRYVVAGDYRDVQLKIQAASARGHESGETPRKNTSVS